ncbi:MAG: hypothetical protein E7B59_16140 [Enterobacteriaceae bacterium]|nr:hypothetical protein [Enterobacteriaceae bacterium]
MKNKILLVGLFISSMHASAEWRHSVTEDKMGRGSDEIASVLSTNTVALAAPYDGAQHATLSLRKLRKNNNEVVLSLERGQIVCDPSGCPILFRADKNEPFSISFGPPKDGSTNVIIADLDTKQLRTILSADKISIELTVFQNGEHIFEFDAADNPFIGRKVYLLNEIKKALSEKNEVKVTKTGDFVIDNSSFNICKQVLQGTKKEDEIIVVERNDKERYIVNSYSEAGMAKSSCRKGEKNILLEFYQYN